MFLKRLNVKGFKSFADSTTLEFEPGVTAVVGPNGSGKSNVVDAVTWVLGAQSTRILRSARMDDVIFSGTPTRPALGRAEVSLTIDNSSGRLPVDGAEVTISRTLFRDGESEYAINGTTCRLLDVQELLADSGVGRQQHMIIGQGQLDSILNASPESRRAVIEEAAGVLKHRRRKERAQRRLDATQENLERLGDLVREVRRQMRPLERQAASARRYGDVEAELRAARSSLYAERRASFEARRLGASRALGEAALAERALRDELITLDAQATAAAADVASRREEAMASSLGALAALAERARGAQSLIAERERGLRAALSAAADETVIATLEADAARVQAEVDRLEAEVEALAGPRAEARAARAAAQTALAVAEGDDERARVTERVADLTRSLDALRAARARVDASRERASSEAAALDEQRAGAGGRVAAAAAALEAARRAADDAEALSTSAETDRALADDALRTATDASARAQARAEALARAFDEVTGAGGRALLGGLAGVLGALGELVEVDHGAEAAVEAAAGAAVGATVVEGRRELRAALDALRRGGGQGLILPVGEGGVAPVDAPAGTTPLRERVRARTGAPAHVGAVLDRLFATAFLARDFDAALDAAATHPGLVVVTDGGDLFSPWGWRLATGRALVTRAAVEEATRVANDVGAELAPASARRDDAAERARAARAAATLALRELARAQAESDRAEAETGRLESDGAAASERAAAAAGEAERLGGEVATLESEVAAMSAGLGAAGPEVGARERARDAVERAETIEADLARREARLTERRHLLETRAAELDARLAGRGTERTAAADRRVALEADLAALARLGDLARRAGEDVALAQSALDSSYREQLEASRAGAERLEELRALRHGAEERLTEVEARARHAEVEQAELGVMAANLDEAIARDLGVEPAAVIAAPVELPEGVTLEARVAELEARITSLGPVNPWALEELAALEERYRDLDGQVADVRHARRELHEAMRALDEEITTTFAAAYADVNDHFSHLIEMLFPGGRGRLSLTDAEDPLNTGVEIEVRPMGRNIRRISLLSGGERSMVTLAFLFAVFRSRPSPFYMMDEVEAALDDVNLQRFLSLVDEFRDEAQLLIVTHQKRTMESADALYGVTMVPGGSSKVVSQRVTRGTEVLA